MQKEKIACPRGLYKLTSVKIPKRRPSPMSWCLSGWRWREYPAHRAFNPSWIHRADDTVSDRKAATAWCSRRLEWKEYHCPWPANTHGRSGPRDICAVEQASYCAGNSW